MRRLILASASPRREMLLRQVGLTFEVIPAEVDERLSEAEESDPAAAVLALAEAKARTVLDRLLARGALDAIVIGADTTVVVAGHVLGKPADSEMAMEMLAQLAGRTHEVLTGVVALDAATGQTECGVERTLVTMTGLKDETIRRYVATGETMDKAGSYAVQGLGSLFIESIEGCYFNVVGLPLALLDQLLVRLGFDVVNLWPPAQPLSHAEGAQGARSPECR